MIYVRVAQLDRAFDYGSKGREFESSRARSQKWSRSLVNTGFRDFFMHQKIVSLRVFPLWAYVTGV